MQVRIALEILGRGINRLWPGWQRRSASGHVPATLYPMPVRSRDYSGGDPPANRPRGSRAFGSHATPGTMIYRHAAVTSPFTGIYPRSVCGGRVAVCGAHARARRHVGFRRARAGPIVFICHFEASSQSRGLAAVRTSERAACALPGPIDRERSKRLSAGDAKRRTADHEHPPAGTRRLAHQRIDRGAGHVAVLLGRSLW
jgi:hypothetical protein